MPDSPENDTFNPPEVSTEAARQALDAMSEELLLKLNRMIEEQEARVQEFAVQNPSLSSLPVTPKPIELPTHKLPQVAATPAKPAHVSTPRPAPQPPTFPPKDEPRTDITPQEAVEEFERRWKQIKRERNQQPDRNQEDPPVPPARFPKPSLPSKTKPKKESNIGTWVFFIVVLIIIMRACSE